jgi:hypothetical protein
MMEILNFLQLLSNESWKTSQGYFEGPRILVVFYILHLVEQTFCILKFHFIQCCHNFAYISNLIAFQIPYFQFNLQIFVNNANCWFIYL